MKKVLFIFCFFSLLFVISGRLLSQHDDHYEQNDKLKVEENSHIEDKSNEHHTEKHGEEKSHHEAKHAAHADEHGTHDEHAEGEHGGHHSDMAPLFFIIIALIIGAATRHLFQKIPIPYTVTLLIFGFLLGFASQKGFFDGWGITAFDLEHFNGVNIFNRGINWAGHIDPHMVLYIFLPVLIFEAAFAMDTHTFKKIFANATILAVPGFVVSFVMTAALMVALKTFGFTEHLGLWSWPVALLFGTVISANDPVAVVALLKELGASKKLGTLIEGESLLNDGTAIVIYLVLIGTVTGTANPDAGALAPLFQFFIVALGGIATGLLIGWLTIGWVKRAFNDAMIEINVIVVAAFLTFFIAEYFFHVSGVLGLVALGLVMASIGRTRISPEVEHFLHEFWELAAFIANTLIFIIVGVVIAEQAVFSGKVNGKDFIILGLIYIGIHVVRAIVLFIFYPAMKRIGYGLPVKDSKVLWYGALRGAIGLALALMVAGQESIPQVIRDQFLFYTAGIVMLTLMINATTIGYLVKKLGLTKLAPAKALIIKDANNFLIESSKNSIEKIKNDRYMSKANWKAVEEYLPEPIHDLTEVDLESISNLAEIRRRILEKEKSSYWSQFKEGLIGPSAVMRLSEGINEILDSGGQVSLSDRSDLENEWKTPKLLNKMQSFPVVGRFARKAFFDRLSISYDTARGFVTAQEEALSLVQNMLIGRDSQSEIDESDLDTLKLMEQEINENRIHGMTFIRNLRNTYPEIYKAIATRQAVRSVLNYEMKIVERLQKKGRLDSGESGKMIHSIEKRMKKLQDSPPTFALPNQFEMLQNVSWLQMLGYKQFNRLKKTFKSKIYSVGEKIIREDTPGNGLYVIVRGKVKVTYKNEVIDILGTCDSFGEMSLLTGMPRTATISAESPVTVLFVTNKKIMPLLESSAILKEELWKFASKRFVENLLRQNEPYKKWVQKEFRQWLKKGKMTIVPQGTEITLEDEVGIIINGQIERIKDKRKVIAGPAILESGDVVKSADAKIYRCNIKESSA